MCSEHLHESLKKTCLMKSMHRSNVHANQPDALLICLFVPQFYGVSLDGSLGNSDASLTLGKPSHNMTIRSKPNPPPA